MAQTIPSASVAPEPTTLAVVADDTGRDGQVIKRALKNLGYQANVVEKAPQGVELIASGVGALFFVNKENAALDGLAAVRQVKGGSATAHIPVILTSFGKTAHDVVAARQAGADGYVMKPLNEKAIVDQVTAAARTTLSALVRTRHMEEERIASFADGMGVEQELRQELFARIVVQTRRLVSLYPWFSGAFLEHGKMLLRLNQGPGAVLALRKAVALNSKEARASFLLADYYAGQGELDKAIAQIRSGLQERFDAIAMQKLGELQMRKGDHNGAILTFNKVVDALGAHGVENPKERAALLAHGLNQRGSAFREKGLEEKNDNLLQRAVADFTESAKIDPSLLAAKYNLMVTFKKMGQTEKALAVLDEIRASEPDSFDGWLELAEAYHHDHEAGKAAFALEKAALVADGKLDQIKTVCDRMVLYAAITKAEVLLRITQKKVPKDVYFCHKLGIVYRRLGKPELTVEQFRAGLALAPDDAALHFNLGRALHERGDTAEAKELFEKSLELDPELGEAREYLEKAGG